MAQGGTSAIDDRSPFALKVSGVIEEKARSSEFMET